MKQLRPFLNLVVAATLTLTSSFAAAQENSAQLAAPDARLEVLLSELADPNQEHWQRIERQILRIWGQSGSPAIDYVFQQGQRALQAGRAEEAIEHFSAVIDHDPDFAEAWNGRATAYYLANRLGQSLADIEQVLLRNPRHFGAFAGLGMIMEQLDQPEEARAAYEESIAIHPHQAQIQNALARLELARAGQSL